MIRSLPFAPILFACLLGLAAIGAARAQEEPAESAPTDQEQSIERGKQALNGYPWYDAETDSFRRMEVKSAETPPPPTNVASTPTPPNLPKLPTGNWSFLGSIMQVIPWLVLIALIVGLLYLFAKYYVRPPTIQADKSKKTPQQTKKSEVERLQSLPFDVDRPVDDLLAETQRQYEAGNFDAAIVYLYSFLLVELDRHHRIRLEKGKTNRQYLREVRPRPELRPALEETMVAFEEVFFGHHSIDRQRFESCWQMVPQFRASLAK